MASTRHRTCLRYKLMNGTLEGLFWSPWGSHSFQGILWSFPLFADDSISLLTHTQFVYSDSCRDYL